MRAYRHFAGEVVEVEEELDVERIPKALLDEQFLQISVEQSIDVVSCVRCVCAVTCVR